MQRPFDLLGVRLGEKVPVDGLGTVGSCDLDKSMLTGEPIPVIRRVGDKLIGATLNNSVALVLRFENVGSAMLLSQILPMMVFLLKATEHKNRRRRYGKVRFLQRLNWFG